MLLNACVIPEQWWLVALVSPCTHCIAIDDFVVSVWRMKAAAKLSVLF